MITSTKSTTKDRRYVTLWASSNWTIRVFALAARLTGHKVETEFEGKPSVRIYV